ncbi:hypothetical protein LshimejAT787_0408740 [Lyophyllum shimeji]|uniref:Uncharacterized protein n=1 Tax=Lyophyllum shimeji TaxID=47721 RepID=A0A9P3ULN7_LYOSH|nr:hypothetical protein LshimejAT787_0408740 [Lyophyllum shimeji]
MPRLSVLDILHRGVVYSLRGKGLFNLSRSVSLFSSTERIRYRRRREAAAQLDKIKQEEEMTLAEAAQSALPSRQ